MSFRVNLLSLCVALLSAFHAVQGKEVQPNNTDIREEYLRLVEWSVTGSLFDELGRCNGFNDGCVDHVPYDWNKRLNGRDWPVVGHTMVGHLRTRNVKELLLDVIKNDVPGDFVELGVWRGGACIYARCVLNAYGQLDRKVHVFDAFEQIPGYGAKRQSYLAVSEKQVIHNFEKYNAREGVEFYKGLFKDTTPKFSKDFTGQIAVLRIDGNFYDSYQDAMYYLYDKVPVGGYVVFDDIVRHAAVKEFWEDFKKDQNVDVQLTFIDGDSSFFKKIKASAIDFKHFKPPRDCNKV